MLPATPGRSKMNASLQNLSSASAFEDVKNVCARFTSKFDAWVAQAKLTKKRHANEFQQTFQEHLGMDLIYKKLNNKRNSKGTQNADC